MNNDSRLIDWLLRIAVAMQAFGYAWKLGVLTESPMLGWLWEPADVGGLALGEPVGLIVSRVIAAVLAVAAIMTLVWPSRLMLLAVAVFQLVYAYATWQIGDGFLLPTAWLGSGVIRTVADGLVPFLPFVTGAARIALPIVLILTHWSPKRKLLGLSFGWISEWLMRVSIALTFAGHGLEALAPHPKFVDWMMMCAVRLLDTEIGQLSAQRILVAVGVIDLAVAVLILIYRSRLVAGYMALWGFATAAARLVVLPTMSSIAPGYGASEFCQRASHWAIPLLLVLAWRTVRVATQARSASE